MLSFPDAKMEYLSQTSLDHCPMVTQLFGIHNWGPQPFRFQRMWCSHDDFLNVVRSVWLQDFNGFPMIQMCAKMKKLKKYLKKWSFEVFGRVKNDIMEIEKEMVDFKQQLISNYSQEMEVDFLKCKKHRYLHYLHR